MAREVERARIAPNGHLVFQYRDGSIEDVGAVRGADGADGSNALPCAGSPPLHIQHAYIADNGHLVLEYSDGASQDVGAVRGEHGSHGADGAPGADGVDGFNGLAGARGERGEKGERGAQGERGEQGSRGAQGAPGTGLTIKGTLANVGELSGSAADGDAYMVGELLYVRIQSNWVNMGPLRGAQGERGVPGAVGATGSPGSTGATGAQGNKGDPGEQGVPGATGPKGDTGATGPKGDRGDTGAKGEQGASGPQGLTGAKGDTGATGASAYESAQAEGYTGTRTQWLASLKGERGEAGAKGDVGAKGDQGDMGATGAKGDRGAQGIPGERGADGAAGPQGIQGVAGPKGDRGDTGAQGIQGERGQPGPGSVTSVTSTSGALVVANASGPTVQLTISQSSMTLNNIGGTLSVGKGGTGRASLTANAVLFGAGTGAVGVLAPPSESGKLLQWNGSAIVWADAPAGTSDYNVLVNKPVLGTAAARNITVSASEPTGGADGDIWIVVQS